MTLKIMRQFNEILRKNGEVSWTEESAKYFVETSLLEKGQATYVSSGTTESYVVYVDVEDETVLSVAHVDFSNSRCDFLS